MCYKIDGIKLFKLHNVFKIIIIITILFTKLLVIQCKCIIYKIHIALFALPVAGIQYKD